jgi:hypothetical protein
LLLLLRLDGRKASRRTTATIRETLCLGPVSGPKRDPDSGPKLVGQSVKPHSWESASWTVFRARKSDPKTGPPTCPSTAMAQTKQSIAARCDRDSAFERTPCLARRSPLCEKRRQPDKAALATAAAFMAASSASLDANLPKSLRCSPAPLHEPAEQATPAVANAIPKTNRSRRPRRAPTNVHS